MKKVCRVCFFLFLFSLPVVVYSFQESRSVLDTIVSTVNRAKPYLDIAKDVANLVSHSLNQKNKQKQEEMNMYKTNNDHRFLKHSFIDGFFRLLKLDSSKIIAIAINSVLFLAQLISKLFDMKTNGINFSEEDESKDDSPVWDPLKYILENKNERIERLIQQAQDPDLPNQLISRTEGSDSSCTRLLLCKTSPIILAAQRSLKDKTVFKNRKMTLWFPSWKEFENNSDTCENQHIDCILFPD